MKILLNKALSKFGLMKISRAKSITLTMHTHYVSCVLKEVEKDFNAIAMPNSIPEAEKWWTDSLDKMLAMNEDSLIIPNLKVFRHCQ